MDGHPTNPIDTRDIEPRIAWTLDRKSTVLSQGPYKHQTAADVTRNLTAFMKKNAPGADVSNVRRLTGGGSKEQFVFDLVRGGKTTHHVMRIDPPQAPVETDRQREYEILRAYQGLIPVPEAQWVDENGDFITRPALIMSFEKGVTKPSGKNTGNVSGLGVSLGGALREKLADQFIDHLVAIHNLDWRKADLPHFTAPLADPQQAARWQTNWWTRVWRDDIVTPLPTVAVMERWFHDNLPACDAPVVVHSDYRNGNFLFDEDTGKITAILDWELAHIGDFHEDVAWVLQTALGSFENGEFYACGMMPRQKFLDEYAKRTGRTIDPKSLRFYETLVRFKNFVLTLATSTKAAKFQHTHQDAHCSWIAAVGHLFHEELCDLMEKAYA